MSLISDYALSLLPGRTRVGKSLLLPLSFGHYLLLHRVGSGVLTGETVQQADVALIVGICRQPWEEAANALETRRFRREVKWRSRFFRWFPSYYNVCRVQLKRYFKAHLTAPETWDPPKTHAASLCDPQAAMQILGSELHWQPTEIMSMPWRAVIHELLGVSTRKGDVKLMTDWDKDTIAKLKARQGKGVANGG